MLISKVLVPIIVVEGMDKDAELLLIARSLSNEDITLYAETFYRSYLECLNNSDSSYLVGGTEFAKKDVEDRLERDGNKNYRFEYVSCGADVTTRYSYVAGESAVVQVDILFNYTYSPRTGGGSKQEESNVQMLQFVYVEGTWLVNRFYNYDY